MLRDVLGILTVISLALTFWRWRLHRRFPLHVPPPKGSGGRAATTGASQREARYPADAVGSHAGGRMGVTFLKPLKGRDAETKECLRSWFEQDYPEPIQLLFGVATADDPAAGAVRELIAEYPRADAQCVVCGENLGANRKVSTLRQLEPLVKHPILMISDADVRAPKDFAAGLTPLCGEGVGLVNCFYRLANPATVAMRWEAVAINADFWTTVLQAASFKKLDFALGAVMTLPTEDLRGIGGFAALADYLADDYQLGHQIAARGREIALAPLVADCWEAPMGWRAVWRHQLRWARTIRICQPGPFFMSVINNSSVWPLFLMAASLRGPAWAAALAGGALLFRILTAQQQQARMTRDWSHLKYWWLVPIKDVLDLALWAAAFWGNRIEWRGERFRIGPGGKLEKI